MADTKLSDLTLLAAGGLADADEFYVNDGGVSKKLVGSSLAQYIGDYLGYQAITTETELATAITEAASNPAHRVVATSIAIATNRVIPADLTLTFVDEGAFAPSGGVDVTWNGHINAGRRVQIFAGAGTHTFTTGSKQVDFFPEWWGAVADGGTTDCTAAFNAAFDAIDTIQSGRLLLGRGTYEFNSGNIDVHRNTHIVGIDRTFGSVLRADGPYQLTIDGEVTAGGFALRNTLENFLLDCRLCSAGTAMYFNDCYNIVTRNVFVFEQGTITEPVDVTGDTDGTTAVITGMADTSDFNVGDFVTTSAGFPNPNVFRVVSVDSGTQITLDTASTSSQTNITVTAYQPCISVNNATDCSFENVICYGDNSDPGQYGVLVYADCQISFYRLDVEVCNRGIEIIGSSYVDILSPYFERNIYHMRVIGSGATLNVQGGFAANPNSGSIIIGIENNPMVNIYGTEMDLNGGNGVYSLVTSTIQDNVKLYGIDPAWITTPDAFLPVVGDTGVAGMYKAEYFNKKTLTDEAAATTFFTLDPAAASPGRFMVCTLTTIAEGSGRGYEKNVRTQRFYVSNPAGTAQVSTIADMHTEIAESSSGNFGVTLTISATVATGDITIDISADATGAVGNGNPVDVYAHLEVIAGQLGSPVTVN